MGWPFISGGAPLPLYTNQRRHLEGSRCCLVRLAHKMGNSWLKLDCLGVWVATVEALVKGTPPGTRRKSKGETQFQYLLSKGKISNPECNQDPRGSTKVLFQKWGLHVLQWVVSPGHLLPIHLPLNYEQARKPQTLSRSPPTDRGVKC